jgi:hypothetical protein
VVRSRAPWVLVVVMLGAAACGGPAIESAAVQASASAAARAVPSATPSSGPHQGVIAVTDVVQGPSSELRQHMVAIRLMGDVGTSAIFRSLEIHARVEPIDGSACDGGVPPTVLRPSHPDAVQPALADQTRTVIVRSLLSGGPGASARFRVGPVPSLNGTFDGWVSFHFPADAAAGFCAFDVSGTVVIVAGETTTADLPVVRVDTRIELDGS